MRIPSLYIAVTIILALALALFILFAGSLKEEGISLLIIVLSLAVTIGVPLAYVIRNYRSLNIFSPYLFPVLFYLNNYTLPSYCLTAYYGREIDRTALYIQTAAICAYFAGLFLYNLISKKARTASPAPAREDNPRAGHTKTIMIFFLILGATLLIAYGIVSGVTISLLRGLDIEDLRRKAEVGKGYLTYPALLFMSISSLWLFANAIIKRPEKAFPYFMFMFLICIAIFLCTGNRVPSLWPFIIAFGIYNRYYRIPFTKIFLFGIIFFLLFSAMAVLRQAGQLTPGELSAQVLTFNMAQYDANYLAVVRFVKAGILKLQYGKEYFYNSIILMIPRFLWPDKPTDFGYFMKEFLGYAFKGGGVPTTPLGSFYVNFGFPGVVTGMLFTGLLYKFLYQLYLNSSRLFIVVAAVYLLPEVLNPSYLLLRILLTALFAGIIIFIETITGESSVSKTKNISGKMA